MVRDGSCMVGDGWLMGGWLMMDEWRLMIDPLLSVGDGCRLVVDLYIVDGW